MRFRVQVIREVASPLLTVPASRRGDGAAPKPSRNLASQNRRSLYFVSDLHLADGSPADDFNEGSHRAAFEWFLEHEVEADGGELILVGDVFELWQASLRGIREYYGPLFWRLFNYRLLRGNHDSAYRAPPEWLWPDPVEPALLAEHGHRADVWNSQLSIVGRGVTVAAGLLERLGLRGVDDYAWRHLPTPVTEPAKFGKALYLDYVRRRARKTGAHLVILGHTHEPLLTDLGDGITYANCGTWVRDDFLGSFLRVRDGAVSLCQVV